MKSRQQSKIKYFPLWFRNAIMFIYDLSLFRIGAIVMTLIILAYREEVLTKGATVLFVIVVLWILLYFLQRWIKKEDL